MISLKEFYNSLLEELGCRCIKKSGNAKLYKVADHKGQGWLRTIELPGYAFVLLADFTADMSWEKGNRTNEAFIELGLFQTTIDNTKRMRAYIRNSGMAFMQFDAGVPVNLAKIIITDHEYFSVLETFGEPFSYGDIPEIVFAVEQLKELPFAAITELYIKSKVDEILTIIIERYGNRQHLPVRLTARDRKALGKVATYLRKNPAAYPSIQELAHMAGISITRFQMAFRMFYGVTVYHYQKLIRLKLAATLLHNRDMTVQEIALALGYRNAGHFAGLFKKEFKITPNEYRKLSLTKG